MTVVTTHIPSISLYQRRRVATISPNPNMKHHSPKTSITGPSFHEVDLLTISKFLHSSPPIERILNPQGKRSISLYLNLNNPFSSLTFLWGWQEREKGGCLGVGRRAEMDMVVTMAFGEVVSKVMPYLAMVLLQFGYAGMFVISVASPKRGMSRYVLVVYRNAITIAAIAPFALWFKRFLFLTLSH